VRITVNGEPRELGDDVTIAALLGERARGSAVVVDGSVVPRASWPDYRLLPGQRVELITAVPGG
jgi:sulfur carrier protein